MISCRLQEAASGKGQPSRQAVRGQIPFGSRCHLRPSNPGQDCESRPVCQSVRGDGRPSRLDPYAELRGALERLPQSSCPNLLGWRQRHCASRHEFPPLALTTPALLALQSVADPEPEPRCCCPHRHLARAQPCPTSPDRPAAWDRCPDRAALESPRRIV